MPTKPKVGLILFMLAALFLLSACGGGNTGATWFNLPSVPVRMQEDGTAKLFGLALPVGAVMAPEQIQQLQGADLQALEARVGYDGVLVFADGEELPYLAWDAESVETLQDVLRNLPPEMGINGGQFAPYLPLLRQYGLGVVLDLPEAEGQSAQDFEPWSGTAPSPGEETGESTLALNIGSLTFDPEGNAYIEGVPVSTLEEALGTSLGLNLDSATLNMLQSIGAENVVVETRPDGVYITMGERTLPRIAYDAERLQQAAQLAGPFVADPAMSGLISDTIALLPGAEIGLGVSFTGEPTMATTLPEVSINVNEDGTLSAFGLPLGTDPMFPSDMLTQLQEANVQHLSVDLDANNLTLAANGDVLPIVSWSDLDTLLGVVQPLLDMSPELMSGAAQIFNNLMAEQSLNVDVSLPVAEGAEPVTLPDEMDTTMATPETNDITPPIIRADATVVDGQIQAINELSADTLGQLGVELPTLPPEVMQILTDLNAETLQLRTSPNQLDVNVNGEPLVSLSYDQASLQHLLNLLQPFLGDTPLQNPAVTQLLENEILPLVPGADIDVTVNVQ